MPSPFLFPTSHPRRLEGGAKWGQILGRVRKEVHPMRLWIQCLQDKPWGRTVKHCTRWAIPQSPSGTPVQLPASEPPNEKRAALPQSHGSPVHCHGGCSLQLCLMQEFPSPAVCILQAPNLLRKSCQVKRSCTLSPLSPVSEFLKCSQQGPRKQI